MNRQKSLAWLKNRKWDILLGLVVVLMLIPNVRHPFLAFAHHLLAGSPTVIANDKQEPIALSSWKIADMRGDVFSPSSSNGKVKIINFWATWCPSCVAELPEFQKLYNQYKGKVDFYFISNESPVVIHKFMQKNGYNLPVYHSVQYLPKAIRSNAIPATYVIDKNKKITVKAIGTKDWYSKDFRSQLNKWIQE